MWQFQAAALRDYARKQGKTPWLVIRVDLTSVAKCGKKLPYLRTYNGIHGIHLVVMHVSLGKLSFPMGCEIYDPASTATPIDHAVRLLSRMHPYHWGGFEHLVVMDAGFYSADVLDLLNWWGFTHVSIGAKANLRLRDGRKLRDAKQAEAVELDSLPGTTFYVAWVTLPRDGKRRRFYTLSTTRATAITLTSRHKRRWLIESFFKSAKHDFGLQETRLRTKQAILNWLLLVWLSTSLALFTQALHDKTKTKSPAWRLTLAQAAESIRDYLMPHWRSLRALISSAKCPLASRRFALIIEHGRGV
ncbi:MAG: transposase [Deinococcota bacterium]